MHCSAKPCARGDEHAAIRPKPLGPAECLTGANPMPPDLMTADQRLTEIGTILAAGLIRLRRRHSAAETSSSGDFRLDFSPARSVHATTGKRRKVAR
jgi:hypothetical protein